MKVSHTTILKRVIASWCVVGFVILMFQVLTGTRIDTKEFSLELLGAAVCVDIFIAAMFSLIKQERNA